MKIIKGKWINAFVICLLTAKACFSMENLSQTKPEYWLRQIEKQGTPFEPDIEMAEPFSGNGPSLAVSKEAVIALAEAIKRNPPALKTIILRGSFNQKIREFEKFRFEKILEALPHNTTILCINFSAIPDGLGQSILKVLKENKTLETVLLRGTSFTEEEALMIAEGLRANNTVKTLDLRGFDSMTLKGKKALREAESLRDKKNPLTVLLPDIPDEYLTENKGAG